MQEESHTVRSNLPVGKLWDYLADYERVVHLGWNNASAHRIDASASCQARYSVRVVWEGIPNNYTACLEEADPPHTLTWSTSAGGARSRVRFDLKATGPEQTDVTVTLTLQQSGALRAFEPLTWGLLRPALLRTVENVRVLDEAP